MGVVLVVVVVVGVIAGIFGLVGGLIWWSIKQQRQREQIWQQTAQQLGLAYTGGRIHGRLHGQSVSVTTVSRGSGNNRQTFTVVSSRLDTPLDLGLSVRAHGFFNDLFQGGHDIQIGDREFDMLYLIQADEDHRARAALTQPLRQLILQHLKRSSTFFLNDQGMVIECGGTTSSARWLHWSLEMVSRAAHHLSHTRAQIPVASGLAGHSHAWARYARARGLRGLDTPLCMWGELDGVYVYAHAVRTNTRTYSLDVRVRFARPLGMGLLVQPKRTLDRLAIFFGSQDHRFGDPVFDDTFRVKVSDVDHIDQVVDQQTRGLLLGLHNSLGPCSLVDDGLSVRLPYVPRDPAVVPRTVQHLTGVAETITKKGPQVAQIGPYR